MNYPDHVKNFLGAQQELGDELMAQNYPNRVSKDILIVVHNQLECTKNCIESVLKNTEDSFTIWVWDNASDKETEEYLKNIATENDGKIKVIRSDENLGFIIPNNRLAEISKSEYLVLLNSDCVVNNPKWDTTMIGMLNYNSKIMIIGYGGGLLDEECMGNGPSGSGKNVDFVSGWCLCVKRTDYEQIGLFDEVNLEFAYGEDSDLSLRAKEAGREIYCMRLNYVEHLQNKTVEEVRKKKDITTSFIANHKYLQKRWAHYLENDRVLLRKT